MQIEEYTRQEIQKLIRRIRNRARTVLQAQDPEAVHDFRVHIRRLRTVLRPLNDVYGKFYVQYFRDALRDIAACTSELRDEEVLHATLDDLSLADANMEDRRQQWLQIRKDREVTLRSHFHKELLKDSFLYPLKQMEALLILPVPIKRSRDGEEFAMETVRAEKDIINKRLQRLHRNLDNPAWFHELRLEFKKLRYMTDFYTYLLPPSARHTIKTARKLQNLLGDLHDCDFIHERLETDPELSADLRVALQERLMEKRTDIHHRIIERLEKMNVMI